MAKGYWIPHLDVSNPQGFQAYRDMADAAHQRYGKEGRHESRSDPLADEKHHDQAKRAERTK